MATSRLTEQLGRVLGGRYRLNAPIGSGASAQVYLADDVTLRRRVAVKVLHPALADDDAFLRRFRAEARAAAALSHPNLMAVYDWGEDDGPYLVLEFLGGGSLRAMLDQGRRLTPSQALVVGLDTARALHFAHRRGFVHRDVKPANLLFGDDGRLRIADFGLARALSEAAWTEPGDGLVGTARYAAPEQAQAGRVDGKADVYALGLVLIEAVSGSVPLVADSTLATLAGRADTAVPVPGVLGPLAAVLERVGQPDPADRPDAAELGRALHAAASELDRPEPLPLAGAVDLTTVRELADAEPTLLPPPDRAPAVDPDATTAGAVGTGPAVDATNGLGASGSDGNGAETTTMSGPPTAVFDGLEMFDDEAPVPTPFDGEGDGRRHRRRRWAWLVLVMLLVAGAAAGLVAYVQAQPATAAVPQVGTVPQAQAEALLAQVQTQAGFERPWQIEIRSDYNQGVPEGHVVRQDPPPQTVLEEGETVTLYVSLGPPFTPVPSLEGLTEEEAEAALVEVGLAVGDVGSAHSETVAAGLVLDWSAGDVERPGELRVGSEVDLVVSIGPAPRTVPDLAGKTQGQAVAELEAVGLGAKVVTRFDDEVDQGLVIGTDPGGGASVERGASVTVVVSKGRDLVTVPDIVGKTLDEVNKALEDAGLQPGDASGKAKGRPFATDPEAGSQVERGTTVDIFLKDK
ncbi:MAG: PASTA domain-containing protein [Actinomycetota bacterium]|nr:PASTA domain-containing protein [Actinomycetota bacterium]